VKRGDDVECEPGARDDDEPSMIVRLISVCPGFALIDLADFTTVLD
jgi:hypothetical protein